MKANTPSAGKQQTTPHPTPDRQPVTDGWLCGTVLGIEPARELFFLRAQETRRKEAIHWARETQFTLDCHPASSTDLRLGQRVRIHCRFTHHELQADNINIEPRDDPGSQPPKVLPLHPEPPMKDRGANI